MCNASSLDKSGLREIRESKKPTLTGKSSRLETLLETGPKSRRDLEVLVVDYCFTVLAYPSSS